MNCTERQRLEQECSNAGSDYEAAREALQAKLGACAQDEFLALTSAVDEGWEALQRARYLLSRHIRDHGCEKACGASAEG